MHPGIEIVEADPAADRRLLEGLADWCDRYTPLVALDGEDGLFLDITGCAHLFGGERAMLDDVLARSFRQGFDVRAGLASTPGAAWAAARFLASRIMEQGEEEAMLAPLPLAALRIDASLRAGLEGVGLRTAGAIMGTPRAPLTRRFGGMPLLRLDQALGRIEETISPRLPVPPLSVERRLAEPILLVEHVESLTETLAAALGRDMERRGEGARAVRLTLFRVDGAVRRVEVGTSRPVRDPARIARLFHEKLAAMENSLDAGYGFELIRLSALAVAAFPPEQASLAANREDAGDDDLALFVDRVRARIGEGAVLRPLPVESHLPERAVAMVPFADVPPQGKERAGPATDPAGPAVCLERPIRLFSHPEPVEVIATEVPEGPPLNFRWRRALYRVARAEGPERIAPEWWRGAEDAQTRDYFRVEDASGRRYWLYRQGLYGVSEVAPRWFMHGIFA
jgi:protein ImuB